MLNEIYEPVRYQKRPIQYPKRPTTQYMSKRDLWICSTAKTTHSMSKKTYEPQRVKRDTRTSNIRKRPTGVQRDRQKRSRFLFRIVPLKSVENGHVSSCHTYDWGISLIWMKHVTWVMYLSTYQRGSRPTSYDDTWPYMSHTWMSHIIHIWMWLIQCGMSLIQYVMSHVTCTYQRGRKWLWFI